MAVRHKTRTSECRNTRLAKRVAKAAAEIEPELKRVKLAGQHWSITAVPHILMPDYSGLCCTDTQTIHVQDGLNESTLMDTYIHEALHACAPWADESWVERTGTELARMLTRLGYRRD